MARFILILNNFREKYNQFMKRHFSFIVFCMFILLFALADFFETFIYKASVYFHFLEVIFFVLILMFIIKYYALQYKKEKKAAERERRLREIVESIRETFDINKIKSNIVNQVGKAFNADICAIKIMDPIKGDFIPMDEASEYRSSDDIKGLFGCKFKPQVVDYISKKASKDGFIVFSDSSKFLEEENLIGTETEELFKYIGFKSSCIIYIFYGNQLIGDLAVHYTTRFVEFSQEDLDFLQALSVQAGAAIYQSGLYEKVKQTAKRETLLREIIESTSTTFDINKIRSNLVNKIGKTFDADLCVIGVLDVTRKGYNLIPMDEHSEYRSSSDIRTIVGYESNPEVDDYFSKKSKDKVIAYSDISKFLEEENLIGTTLEVFLKKDFNFKSSCMVFIFYKGQVIGSLGIHYIKKYIDFSQDDIDFFKTLLLPIGSVLYQALLYRKVKETAKRETLLRRLDHAIRSSLDINELKKTIVAEIGKSLVVDRCTIAQVDINTKRFLAVDDHSEYTASPNFKSTIGLDFESKELEPFKESLFYKKRDRVIQDIENPPSYYQPNEVNILKKYGIKSAYETPITYGGNVLGVLLIDSILEKRHFSEEELDFIKALADQAGIALYQANLYNTVKQSVEKEKLIRNIIEASRSTLDIVQIKQTIVSEIGKTFKADRCNIFEFELTTQEFAMPDEYSEYLSSSDIKSIQFLKPQYEEVVNFFFNKFKRKEEVNFINSDEFIRENNLENTEIESFIKEYDIKSSINVPIFSRNLLIGYLAADFAYECTLEDLDFFRVLASQAGIAIYQAKLYEKEKHAAEREHLLRDIISIISSTLDINKIKQSITESIGKAFNFDRCFIVEYDPNKDMLLPIDEHSEYRSSNGIKSVVGFDFSQEGVSSFKDWGKNKIEIFVSSAHDFIEDNKESISNGLDEYVEKYDVKSAFQLGLYYGEDFLGILVGHAKEIIIEYIEEEKEFLKTLAGQTGIAIYQAKLYEKEKQSVKREFAQRNFAEIVRSTLNIDLFKKIAVNEIGKIFEADRCFIAVYNKETMAFKKPKIQYLSDKNLKKIDSFDPYQDSIKDFAQIIVDQGILYIGDTDLFVEKNNLKNSNTEKYYQQYQIKSDYSLQVWDTEKEKAYIVIQYTKKSRYLTVEEVELHKYLANQTAIAFQQAQLYETVKQTAERESLLIDVIGSIRSSLDLEEILKIICEKVAKVFDIERATITEFPEVPNYGIYKIHQEYNPKEGIIGVKKILIPENVSTYWGKNLVSDENIIAIDNIQESNIPDFLKNFYKPIGVKSIFGVPIGKGDEKWGFFLLSKLDKHKHWTEEEIELLKAIADQLLIAIKQAELFEKERETAKREKIIREFIEVSRSTLDKETFKKVVVEDVGKTFGADRCFFVTLDKKTKSHQPILYQYLSGSDINKIIFKDYKGAVQPFQDIISKEGTFVIIDTEKLVKEYQDSADLFKEYLKDWDIKSLYIFPVWDIESETAYLVLHYTKKIFELSKGDIDLLKILASQATIAFIQTDLYEKEKEIAVRESLQRNIIETIRSTIDKYELKNILVNAIGSFFHADIVLFSEFDESNNMYSPVDKYSEYLSDPRQKSFIDYDWSDPSIREYIEPLIEKKELNIFCWNEYKKENHLNQAFIDLFEGANVQSSYNIPAIYGDKIIGFFSIQFTRAEYSLSIDELNLIRDICSQSAIGLYQAELYEILKKTAEREALQRSIVETIRGTINKQELKSLLVRTIGEFFKADRVLFSEFDEQNNRYYPVDSYSEYLSSPKEQSFINYDWSDPSIREYIEPLIEKQELKIFSWEEYKKENFKSQAFIDIFEGASVRSSYNIPAIYGDEIMGYFCIEFTQREYRLSKDELNLIRDICSQTAIGLYQAKLYEAVKQTAERETTLREIVSTISSTLDFNNIRKTLVTRLGEAIGSDFDILYIQDLDTNRFITIDEYSVHLSSSEMESPVGTNIIEDYGWGDAFRTGEMAEVIYSKVEDFKSKFNVYGTKGEQFLDKYNIKSCIAIPVKYANLLLGVLAMNYTKQYKSITKEEINFVRAAAYQAGIALYQARLYEKQKKAAKKEKLLREIISEIRGSQSLDEVYNYILRKFTDIFQADRCVFLETPNYKYETPHMKYEYIRNNELKPLSYQEISAVYLDKFKEAGETLTPAVVNSLLAMPLVRYNRQTKLLGIIALWRSNATEWKPEEIELLKIITESVVNVVWDITKLIEIEDLRNSFVLTLAHDFQVPLVGEKTALEYLLKYTGDKLGPAKELVEEILENNENMTTLLKKSVDIYNYESGKKKLKLSVIKIHDLIGYSAERFKEHAETRSVKTVIETPEKLLLVNVEPREISKVFDTIIENAIDNSPQGENINIKYYQKNKNIIISIHNKGPGMSPDIQQKIFKRYEMAIAIERKIGAGTGLFLSKRIIDAHSGSIWFETGPQQGTTFYISLPLFIMP